jgi:dynamin-like GTPase MGM1, mitochondrial
MPGRQAVFLSDRASLLKMRLLAIKSKQCSTKANKYHCPEIFLDVVADKLTSTAVLFLNVELLSEFYYNFPRELDLRLGKGLSEAEIERFASEDPKIKRQLDVIKKKDMLELVLRKIEGLRALEGRAKREAEGRGREEGLKGRDGKGGRWSLF